MFNAHGQDKRQVLRAKSGRAELRTMRPEAILILASDWLKLHQGCIMKLALHLRISNDNAHNWRQNASVLQNITIY